MTEMNGHCNRHGLNQHGMLHLLQVFLHSPIPSVMLVVLVNPESCQEGTSHADISHCATILPALKSREISVLGTGQLYFYKTHTGYCSVSRAPADRAQEYKCCFVTTLKNLLDFPNNLGKIT